MSNDVEFLDSLKAAKLQAMKYLVRREHSCAELATKLRAKGFAKESAKAAINELADRGLQSDQRFAENYARSRSGRGFGKVCIQKELQDRKVADAVIDIALDFGDEFWLDQAQKVRSKKFGSLPPMDFESKCKQMKFLQYRGFTADQIKASFE